eukprot:GHVO01030458.1.p1 GENE.GHVO01030458.1~~GHVO01030458.1.p1  ORF type:complete len:100 (+),score=1.74 GHVO01030458.1:256-555(+)
MHYALMHALPAHFDAYFTIWAPVKLVKLYNYDSTYWLHARPQSARLIFKFKITTIGLYARSAQRAKFFFFPYFNNYAVPGNATQALQLASTGARGSRTK